MIFFVLTKPQHTNKNYEFHRFDNKIFIDFVKGLTNASNVRTKFIIIDERTNSEPLIQKALQEFPEEKHTVIWSYFSFQDNMQFAKNFNSIVVFHKPILYNTNKDMKLSKGIIYKVDENDIINYDLKLTYSNPDALEEIKQSNMRMVIYVPHWYMNLQTIFDNKNEQETI